MEAALSWKRRVIAILLFSVAFGYLEAAVVSYLRVLHEPARQRFHPGRPAGELFPLLTMEQARETRQMGTLAIEIGREAATLIMLAAVAMAVSANAGQWFAGFALAFGAWDLMFYVFLKVLLGWPASLLTWDILFLIPVPWAAPVLAPSIVSALMVAAGLYQLRREAVGAPVRIARWQWGGIVAGALILIVSFAMDYRNLLDGGMPHPFHWGVFFVGAVIGTGSYARAAMSGAGAKTNRVAA